jgi:hypothetical protein
MHVFWEESNVTTLPSLWLLIFLYSVHVPIGSIFGVSVSLSRVEALSFFEQLNKKQTKDKRAGIITFTTAERFNVLSSQYNFYVVFPYKKLLRRLSSIDVGVLVLLRTPDWVLPLHRHSAFRQPLIKIYS